MNFGMFATPERNLVFDINDFDETLPAPWEWDLKRLAVSFAVAARDNGHSDAQARDAAIECVRAYREHLRDYSKMSPLEVWYDRLDEQTLIAMAPDAEARKRRKELAAKARAAHRRVPASRRSATRSVDTAAWWTSRRFSSMSEDEDADRQGSRGARRLSPVAARRPSRAVRPLPPAGHRRQGRRHRQRRHALSRRPCFSPRRTIRCSCNSRRPAPRCSRRMRAASVYRESGAAGRRGATADAVLQRHLPGLDSGRTGFHFFGRQLRDMKFSFPVEGRGRRKL